MKWTTIVIEAIPHVILAIFGGVASLIINKDEIVNDIKTNLGELFLSAFAGLIMFLLLTDGNISSLYIGAACGVAGMSAKRVLTIISKKIFGRIK